MNIHQFPIASILLAGVIVGSFLNVCIYRLPRDISMWRPRRSFCPACQHLISWWQNIPLMSYLLLRGRCQNCDAGIPWRYPLVEVLTPTIALLICLKFGLQPKMILYTVFFWALLVISFIDAEFRRIPTPILIFLLATGIILNIAWAIFPYATLVTGLLYGFTLLWLIRLIGNLLTGVESMGWGDIKLCAVLGFYLGWQGMTATLFFASFIAILIYYGAQLFGRTLNQRIPFAPFLSIGAFITVFWGDVMWAAYLRFAA